MRARYGGLILAAAVGNLVRGARKLSQQKKGEERREKPAPKMNANLIPLKTTNVWHRNKLLHHNFAALNMRRHFEM
jgi:hypothetical protein